MKRLVITSLIFLCIVSCNSNKKTETSTISVDPNSISLGDIRHDTLTNDQEEKIKMIHAAFAEVSASSLEETITNFKRDLDVDKEITIWQHMAAAYKNYLQFKNNKPDMLTKLDAYKLVLSRSMAPDDEAIKNANLTVMDEKEARLVLRFYNAEPEPIKIQGK